MYLIFDVETNGLPKDYGARVHDVDNWPRMLQLAWSLYDEEGNKIKERKMYIKPEGFELNSEAAKIHGITESMLMRGGVEVGFSIKMFMDDLNLAKTIIGHNVSFDKNILGAEMVRLGLEDEYNEFKELPRICTMQSSTNFCKIYSSRGYKWPKLQELHKILFGNEFEDAHDALADVNATAKCFFELKKLNVI